VVRSATQDGFAHEDSCGDKHPVKDNHSPSLSDQSLTEALDCSRHTGYPLGGAVI
jgi:hypothetical protein